MAIEIMRIVKELMEIWPNEVCDSLRYDLLIMRCHDLAKQLSHFLFFFLFCFILFS